jgi:hypothetical protein
MPIILATWEAGIGRIMGLGKLSKKFTRPHLSQWLGMVAYTYDPSYLGCISRKITVQAVTA